MDHLKSRRVSKPTWATDEAFPSAQGEWSAWRPPLGRRKNTEHAVRSSVYRWHPWDPLLVATPDSKNLLPPICIPALSREIQARTLFQYRIFLVVAFLFSFAATLAGWQTGDPVFIKAGVSVGIIFLLVLAQYLLIFTRIERLRATSRFVAWIYMHGWKQALAAIILMLGLGAFQYVLQTRAGGLDALLMSFGLVFEFAPQQPWRYVLGPFIHSGVTHWAGNAAMLALTVGLSSAMLRPGAWSAVLIFGILGPPFILAFLPHALRLDAFVGISGGVFSLLGLIGGFGLAKKKLLPPFFAINIIAFSLMLIFVSHLMSARSNDVVHVLGWGVGFILGIGLRNYCIHDRQAP